MFCDLNVPWTSIKDPELPRTLAFLAELGYTVVVLNHIFTGKLPAERVCPQQLCRSQLLTRIDSTSTLASPLLYTTFPKDQDTTHTASLGTLVECPSQGPGFAI